MSAARLVIYGATGYTGELIAREAVRRGLRPVLAGRNAAAVAALARRNSGATIASRRSTIPVRSTARCKARP